MLHWLASVGKKVAIWPTLYCLWATLAIGLSMVLAGLSAENVTRLCVIVFLLGQIAWRSTLRQAFPWLTCKARFIVLGTILAMVVEGLHMISTPVFLSLRIGWDTSFMEGLLHYALDLLFTVPAYLVIFAVIWHFITHYHYTFWQYVIIMGLAQALGDGGLLYFINAPTMLVFMPYPMTNYHAINVIPFLAVRDHVPHGQSSRFFIYLAMPALIATYLVCGAIIKLLGRVFGLETT